MALNHALQKPEKIVAAALGELEQELVLPNLVQREGIDNYRGAKDDTINVVVEGILPFHQYTFRSGETDNGTEAGAAGSTRQALTFDRYSERKVPITFQGILYSAVEMTDEQKDFDFGTWNDKILRKQVRAVGRGISRQVADAVIAAPYEVTIGDAELEGVRKAVFEARRVLNRFNAPQEGRILVVGTDFEAALLGDEKIVFASNVGDSRADTALGDATLGRLAGFTVVVSNDMPADEAFAMTSSGVVLATAAPSLPQSVTGSTQSFEGYALRWMQDYYAKYRVDRSILDAYAGTRYIKDNLVGWDAATGQEKVSAAEHFVRGVKLHLTDESVYPAPTDEVATITGVSSANAWPTRTAANGS